MERDVSEASPREAQENLRVIRDLMERSTRYSTFSGLSGVLAGTASIVGCEITNALQRRGAGPGESNRWFLLTWLGVIAFAVGADWLLTKRRAARVGKRILSRLGKQMAFACLPALGSGALLTPFFLRHGLRDSVYPLWMLSYGTAVCAVGLFSQREVKLLGAAFLVGGAITLYAPAWGLPMMAATFGGLHIVYGLAMSQRDGW